MLDRGLIVVEAVGGKQSHDSKDADPSASNLQAGIYPYSSVQTLKVLSTAGGLPDRRIERDEVPQWSAIWQVQLSDGRLVSWPNPEDNDNMDRRDAAENFTTHLADRWLAAQTV